MTKRVTKPGKGRCGQCGQRFGRAATGRPREYCSAACRQRAYESRRARRDVLGPALRRDVQEAVGFQADVKREVLRVLAELHLPAGQLEQVTRAADEQRHLEGMFARPARTPRRGKA